MKFKVIFEGSTASNLLGVIELPCIPPPDTVVRVKGGKYPAYVVHRCEIAVVPSRYKAVEPTELILFVV